MILSLLIVLFVVNIPGRQVMLDVLLHAMPNVWQLFELLRGLDWRFRVLNSTDCLSVSDTAADIPFLVVFLCILAEPLDYLPLVNYLRPLHLESLCSPPRLPALLAHPCLPLSICLR